MVSKSKTTIEKITLPTPFLVGDVNVYLIINDIITLVDTGPNTEETKEALKQSLKKLGFGIDDIEQVVLTHHHPDHVGLTEEFFSQKKIIGHQNAEKWLVQDEQFISYIEAYFTQFFQEHGVLKPLIEEMVKMNRKLLSYTGKRGLDSTVAEGDIIAGLPGWKVIETLGHAQSHISLFREEDQLLIGGDHIIEHISSNAILEAPNVIGEERPLTLIQYRHSLQKCLDLGVKKVLSGHGETITAVAPLLSKRFKEQDIKANKLKKLIPTDGITSFELCKMYYAHIIEKEPKLTMSEVIGHLDLLQERSEITTEMINGVIQYKIK